MTGNMQKLSIRLLKDGLEPAHALREGIGLNDWDKIEGAKIALTTMGGNPPKWSRFLDLSDAQKKDLYNNTAVGLVFLKTSGRWFAISFGMGHVKLDPSKFEQDFGLRVVLNSVDPQQLKSTDVRTPDENTLSRRAQTSRGSDQTAFAIDVERDIVRGLAGSPKDPAFATRVAGTDSLSLDRKMTVHDLTKVCDEAFSIYQKEDYKADFGWADQIRHVREADLIEKLKGQTVAALDAVVKGAEPEAMHLAFPVIYDPERGSMIRYKGFRSNNVYPDLDIAGYLEALRERSKTEYTQADFDGHWVHEVDDLGQDCGGRWKISDCLVFEMEVDGQTYVLSSGRWYQVDKDLAKQVRDAFAAMDRVTLPEALIDENEEKYNKRLKENFKDILCLDRETILPSGSSSRIEACDFLSKDSWLIHVKDQTSSSRLSHLFNQGTVSGRVLIMDGPARDKVRDKILEVQKETGQDGFLDIICDSDGDFRPGDFTVVYAVLGSGEVAKLPFFSLVTLRQAAKELRLCGYKCAFAWIKKPPSPGKRKGKKAKAEVEVEDDPELVEVDA